MKVRLIPAMAAPCGVVLVHFNSMKVRLIHFLTCILVFYVQFQFHEGSINTSFGKILHKSWTLFQFHEGSINTENKITRTKSRNIYFNSMKVRLIQAYARAFSAFASFQFHEGSINTCFK